MSVLRLAVEKKEALAVAEKERRIRERERLAAEQKEAEINRLKSDHSKWLGERDNESKQLRDKLQVEERKARELQQYVEEMKLQSAQIERQKQDEQSKLMEKARRETIVKEEEATRLKHELDEMKRKAADVEVQKRQLEVQVMSEAKKRDAGEELKRQLEEMKSTIAQKEQERATMELQIQQEQASRKQAELAAYQAANAAEVAARAAIEASRQQAASAKSEKIGCKRPLAKTASDDVEMEDVSHPRTRNAGRATGECFVSTIQISNALLIACHSCLQPPSPRQLPRSHADQTRREQYVLREASKKCRSLRRARLLRKMLRNESRSVPSCCQRQRRRSNAAPCRTASGAIQSKLHQFSW